MDTIGRILMVEDELKDVELTLTALEEYSLANEVVVVGDGEEALDYLYLRGRFSARAPGNPAVILLDLKLPKVDGLEVLQEIKANEALKMIPVVVLTSSHEETDLIATTDTVSTPTSSNRLISTSSSTPSESSASSGPSSMLRRREASRDSDAAPAHTLAQGRSIDADLIQSLLESEGIASQVTRVETEPAFLASLKAVHLI